MRELKINDVVSGGAVNNFPTFERFRFPLTSRIHTTYLSPLRTRVDVLHRETDINDTNVINIVHTSCIHVYDTTGHGRCKLR